MRSLAESCREWSRAAHRRAACLRRRGADCDRPQRRGLRDLGPTGAFDHRYSRGSTGRRPPTWSRPSVPNRGTEVMEGGPGRWCFCPRGPTRESSATGTSKSLRCPASAESLSSGRTRPSLPTGREKPVGVSNRDHAAGRAPRAHPANPTPSEAEQHSALAPALRAGASGRSPRKSSILVSNETGASLPAEHPRGVAGNRSALASGCRAGSCKESRQAMEIVLAETLLDGLADEQRGECGCPTHVVGDGHHSGRSGRRRWLSFQRSCRARRWAPLGR